MQVLNLKKDKIDITKFSNTRFMYHPRTKELILDRDNCTNFGSHGDLYYDAKGTNKGYDDYVRGWIGFGGRYKNGVIHFAPPIMKADVEGINNALDFIEYMIKNGANDKIKIRNMGIFGEFRYSDIISKGMLGESYCDNRNPRELFEAWFYGSKVIDKGSSPIAVYQISEHKYTSNVWLAKINNKNVEKSFLRIENPYIVKDKLIENVKSLKQKGFDGIICNETYVVFDKKQIKTLSEASGKKDKEALDKKNEVFADILHSLRDYENIKVGSNQRGFGVILDITDIVKKYFDYTRDKLILLISDHDEYDNTKGLYNPVENIIKLNIIPEPIMTMIATYNDNGKAFELKNLVSGRVATGFLMNQNTFIHELTHAINNLNYKKKKINPKKKPVIRKNTFTNYLSTPEEFNAWFNEIFTDIEDAVMFDEELKTNWNKFKEYVFSNSILIKMFDNKYRKKFINRVYQYWKANINRPKYSDFSDLPEGVNKNNDNLLKETKNDAVRAKNGLINEEKVIAYHGGRKGIKSFSLNKSADGMFYFTNSKDLAKSYLTYNDADLNKQQLYTVELEFNKPLNLRTKESLSTFAKIIQPNMKSLEKEWLTRELKYWEEHNKDAHDIAWYLGNLAILHRAEIKKYALENNYDAILNYEPTPNGRFNEEWLGYIIFNPKQIKIIDKKDANYLLEGVSESNFQKWTEGLPIIDISDKKDYNFSNGAIFVVYHGTREQDIKQFRSEYGDGLIFFSFEKQFADDWATRYKDHHRTKIDSLYDEEKEFRKQLQDRYKKDYGDNWYNDEEILNTAKEELKQWKSKKEQQMGFNPKTMKLFVKAKHIFDPRKDADLVLDEVAKYYGWDMNDNANNYHLDRARKGAWIYFEHKNVIDKIYKLGFDAIVLAEHDNEITTLAVRPINGNIKSSDNNGDWSSSNNIYESIETIETMRAPVYITNNAYDVFKYLGKHPSIRLVIDEDKGLYIFGSALYHIHSSLFDVAVESGYYEFSNKVEKDGYLESLPEIIIDKDEFFKQSRIADHYLMMLDYGKFVVYYRDIDFTYTKFYQVLNSKFKLQGEENIQEE